MLRGIVDTASAANFRNAYYHGYLDRHAALERLQVWGSDLTLSHDIPAKAGRVSAGEGGPVNQAEQRLRELLGGAGFQEPLCQHEILRGKAYEGTIPDFFSPGEDDDPGVCLYLDGLSRHLHGSPETAAQDKAITAELASRRYLVLPRKGLHSFLVELITQGAGIPAEMLEPERDQAGLDGGRHLVGAVGRTGRAVGEAGKTHVPVPPEPGVHRLTRHPVADGHLGDAHPIG